jgi:hypothetical protein
MADTMEEPWDPVKGLKLHQDRVSHGAEAVAQPTTEEIGQNADPLVRGSTSFGFILPEYNPALAGIQGIRAYDKMRRGDAQVKASLRMVKSPILTAQFYPEPLTDRDIDKEIAEFVWWNFNNMHRPFIEFIREMLSVLDFGCYAFEKVWEYVDWRPLPTEDHSKPNHRRVVKWQDLVPRHPAKFSGFDYDGRGKLAAVRYGAAGVPIEIDKLIYLAIDAEADDPLGTSVLRSSYKHWYMKEAFYKFDGAQKERHGMGIPVVELLPGYSQTDVKLAHELGSNLRLNESAYVIQLPNMKVGFIKVEGNLVNILDSAKHHGLMILESVLTQFLSLGTGESGSRGVASTQIDAFTLATRYVLDFLLGMINSQLIPQLVDFNYPEVDGYPKVQARVIGDEAKMRALATGAASLAHEGLLTPDDDVENFLRELMGMSPLRQSRSVKDRLPQPAGPPEPPKPKAGQ